MSLLDEVKNFYGIHRLTPKEVESVCAELRQRIIDVTLKNGGHLGSSLGTVELIVALLRAYNLDKDKIIFDVGHQAYAYKMLTGRLDAFDTLRTKGGVAGFPRMSESRYDFFTTGHSSTSLSAAAGYAKARDLKNEKHEVIAVIGDGALLNGESFEALNYMGHSNNKVIIVLNDNAMSINKRIGGAAGHLAKLAVNPSYLRLKEFIKQQCRALSSGETIENRLSRIKTKLKSLLLPVNIFEEFNISYWGPFDGHNVQELQEVFELAKIYDRPLLIHVITKKGKGFKSAEANPCFYHGVAPNSHSAACKETPATPSWSAVFGDIVQRIAETDKRITVSTAAMTDGMKLNEFAKRFPSRFFDVGIAEEHMMTYAAGLAAGGMRPVVCVYSTFLQRAVDQIVHDICLPKLPVLIGIDRAGFVGEDGETHQGLFDISWMRTVPELIFAAPRDIVDLQFFIYGWLKRGEPMAIRYPRDAAERSLTPLGDQRLPAEWGKLEVLRAGEKVCLIGLGSTVGMMFKASQILERERNLKVTVADLRFIRPLDWAAIDRLINSHELIITAEEGILCGGIGEAISAYANASGARCRIIALGAPDQFIPHASRAEQLSDCGLTARSVANRVLEI